MNESTAPAVPPADGIAEFYCWVPPADDVEETRRELAREFAEWSILVSDRDRWWALWYPALSRTGWPARHKVTDVVADSAEELRERLREVGP